LLERLKVGGARGKLGAVQDRGAQGDLAGSAVAHEMDGGDGLARGGERVADLRQAVTSGIQQQELDAFASVQEQLAGVLDTCVDHQPLDGGRRRGGNGRFDRGGRGRERAIHDVRVFGHGRDRRGLRADGRLGHRRGGVDQRAVEKNARFQREQAAAALGWRLRSLCHVRSSPSTAWRAAAVGGGDGRGHGGGERAGPPTGRLPPLRVCCCIALAHDVPFPYRQTGQRLPHRRNKV
jgi:hypothetical protein